MNNLEKLIAELCPDGVEYKPLGEIGEFYGGLTGKSKKDFESGNAKFISYMNVFSNPTLDIDCLGRVHIGADEKQNTIQYGDVIFTGSSETPDECGMSSVLTTRTNEKLYLNSFCFGYRLFDNASYEPRFLSHLLRSDAIRKQICKTASGVTRFNVSKVRMANVEIPLPPLPVQEEIVRILDGMTGLIGELESELAARRKQYEWYRDRVLGIENGREEIENGELRIENEGSGRSTVVGADALISPEAKPSLRSKSLEVCGPQRWPMVKMGDVCVTVTPTMKIKRLDYHETGETPIISQEAEFISGYCDVTDPQFPVGEYVCFGDHSEYVKFVDFAFVQGADGLKILKSKNDRIISKFLYYAAQCFYQRHDNYERHFKYFHDTEIPLPPLAVQRRIVEKLDAFDKLCNSATEGLPAEISARKKQYEYYRDKLLDFSRGGAERRRVA